MTLRMVAQAVWSNPGNRGKRVTKAFAAAGWQMQKRILGTSRTLTLANGRKFIAYPDCVVSSALIYSDWPEYREISFIRTHMLRGSRILDIGAYAGHLSILFSDLTDPEKIVAVEPSPISFRRLTENWRVNGWDTRLLVHAALGDHTGLAFVPDDRHPDTARIVRWEQTLESNVEVPLKKLDDLRSVWFGEAIGLLKIDVEGSEFEVFSGAAQTLEIDRPRLIMFESLGQRLAPDIGSLLKQFGYQVFRLDPEGRPEWGTLTEQNLFATPEEQPIASLLPNR